MATDRSDWPKKVEMAGQILVTQTANEERLSAPGLGGSQRVAFSAVGDNCELCASLDGKVFMADSDLARRYNPPLHPNCNCLWVEVGDDEPWDEADQDYMTAEYEKELAGRELLGKATWIDAAPGEGKYEVLRVPAAPRGRDFTFRRELDPKTGEMRSRLTWHRERYELPGLDARTIVDGVADVGERWRPLGGGGGASVPPVPPSGGPPAGPAPTAAARPVDGPITSLRGAEVERAIGEAVRAVEMPSPGAVVERTQAQAARLPAPSLSAQPEKRHPVVTVLGRKTTDATNSVGEAPPWIRQRHMNRDLTHAAQPMTGRPTRPATFRELQEGIERIARESEDQFLAASAAQRRVALQLQEARRQRAGWRERRRLTNELKRRTGAVDVLRRERTARCLDELFLLSDDKAAQLHVDRGPLLWSNQAVDRGLDLFRRLIRRGSPLERVNLRMRAQNPLHHRSSYFKQTIRIAWGSSMDEVVHELGHALEESHPEILARALRFRSDRTEGYERRRLRDDHPDRGYGPREFYFPDRWFNDYCGRDYGDEATEIVSMGLQELLRDPIGFTRGEPDYVALLWGIITM